MIQRIEAYEVQDVEVPDRSRVASGAGLTAANRSLVQAALRAMRQESQATGAVREAEVPEQDAAVRRPARRPASWRRVSRDESGQVSVGLDEASFRQAWLASRPSSLQALAAHYGAADGGALAAGYRDVIELALARSLRTSNACCKARTPPGEGRRSPS